MNRYFDIDANVEIFGMNLPHAQIHMRKVYLTLFCTLMSSASGTYLHLLWNIGGLLTLLACIGTGVCLILAQLWNEWKGVPLLLVTAFCEGASIVPLIDLVFKTDPGIIISASVGIAVACGCFSLAAMLSRRRDYIYLGGLLSSSLLIHIWLQFPLIVFGDYPLFLKCELYIWLLLYMLVMVMYSEWTVEWARHGDLNYVKDAFILFAISSFSFFLAEEIN